MLIEMTKKDNLMQAETPKSLRNILSTRLTYQFHPHHLTNISPWPIFTANSVLSLLEGAVLYFNGIVNGDILCRLGFVTITISFIL